ncbi:MAG TPA: YajQ family cyclic di-GMP-binding protein [bacterium]|nr:YajQ family cyclic di-GMP-binding protein [bacterium]
MASESSFDVVSEFDRQELVNAIDIARREISNRYDLKNSKSTIELQDAEVVIQSQDDYTLKSVIDILESKVIKRGLSIKIFEKQKVESAAGSTVRQSLKLRKSLTTDQCRELNKRVREQFKKVKTQIQGDSLRVTDKSRDTLQEVIAYLRSLDFEAPLQFTNYR